MQQVVSWLRSANPEKPCKLPHSILNDDLPNLNVVAGAEILAAAGGLAMADWLNALTACGLGHAIASGNLLPPVAA